MEGSVEDTSEIEVEHFKWHVETFLDDTIEARQDSELSRDYVNHYQWSEEEIATLRSRKQAPVVVNRIKPKIDGLKGLLIQRKTDPKAFPRTQDDEEAAHAVTDGLRYVTDNVDFDETKIEVADEFFVEGYGGAIVEVTEKGDEIEIRVNQTPWDRIYFDPHSRKHDFSDASYIGLIVWMDLEAAVRMYGEVVRDHVAGYQDDGETFDDRPRWFSSSGNSRMRLRIAQEFYVGEGGKWHMVIFTGEGYLVEPAPSPYLDEDGEPMNAIELISAHLDRDNRRYGEVRVWRDLQDEINHRRSKALHANSARQTAGSQGAVADVPSMKREMAKMDGHVEFEGVYGQDFFVLPTGDMADAQFQLLVHATAEMDAVGFNAQLAGERQGDLSGKAILALQGAGANELASLFNKLNGWEKRIYRQIWSRIKQFWTAEKWIRVTDDENALRWVGFSVPITLQERLEEVINDEKFDENARKRAAEMYTQMMQSQDPRLQQQVMTRNNPAELDVDIMLEQSLDTVNVQQEQFELLARLAQARQEVPFTTLLRMSTLRDKDEMIAKIEEREKALAEQVQAQSDAAAAQLEAETKSKIVIDEAETKNEVQKGLLLNQQKIEAERELAIIKAQLERGTSAIQVEADNAIQEKRNVLKFPEAPRLSEALESAAAAQASDTDQLAQLQQLLAQLNAPRRIERDDEGRVVAVV